MVASRRLRGASLVEIVVAIVVTSIALSGTLMLVDTTTRRSADPMLERQAISIGESYLEEILQKPFFDPDDGTLCPSPEADRDRYDNVCDYQGLDEIGARDQQGDAIAGLEATGSSSPSTRRRVWAGCRDPPTSYASTRRSSTRSAIRSV
ncbi:MAG: prepilin-type cleavage/methylation domain-containing protein [Myxococcota bacterium]